MGLLNHLFGSKKGIAKELVMYDNKRMALWNEHLSNYLTREQLCKHFNFANVDKALQDFKATDKVFMKIEALISPELVNIAKEEKTDGEILADLKRLKSMDEIEKLSYAVVSVKQKQSKLLKLFHEIHNVLKAELHLIRLVRKKPENVRDLLLRLFEIIFHQEAMLYKVFREECFSEENKHIHTYILKIARAIILEEEIKEEIETDEEKFAKEMVKRMVKRMAPSESDRGYRKLAEDIFNKLAEMAGASSLTGEDIVEAIDRMEGFMKSDKIMYKIVKKLRPKYNDAKIKAVILAFRKAFILRHFEDLETDFAIHF